MMHNWISKMIKCPCCDKKVRVNIEWKPGCEIDHKRKSHVPNINILKTELFHKESE